MGTKFSAVYDCFLGKITDDMYMELTPENTKRDLQALLINAIPGFEFPRKNINNYTLEAIAPAGADENTIDYLNADVSSFNVDLTQEEINILAILMMLNWLQRQITSIENIRMKYSGTDFKFTSQANHLSKLLTLLSECERQSRHLQRLYKRRTLDQYGNIISNWSIFKSRGDENEYKI